MKKPRVQRGYKAVKEEEERREKAREARKGKLWRVFFPKDADEDYEIPLVFLTDEPLCYKEHVINVGGRIEQHTCTEDEDCPYCAEGNKPRFVGAFLVIDRSEVEVKDKKTNKKKIVSDRLKLLVRGTTDLAKLERLDKKYGLLDKEWNVYKTGSDTSTTWNFDRGDEVEFTKKELKNIIPEQFQAMDLYDIVEAQILPNEDEEDEDRDYVDDDDNEDVSRGVVGLDEEEEDEEDKPTRRTRSSKSSRSRRGTKVKSRKLKR